MLDALLEVYAGLMLGTAAPFELRDVCDVREFLRDLVVTFAPSGHMPLCLSSGSFAGAGNDIVDDPSVDVSHLYKSPRVVHMVSASTPSMYVSP